MRISDWSSDVCSSDLLDGDGDRLDLDYDVGHRIDRKCEALGLIVRPLVNMCVFSPPLVITRSQIDEMFDILEEAIRQVRSEEHTSELQSLMRISYAVFCLKKKNTTKEHDTTIDITEMIIKHT